MNATEQRLTALEKANEIRCERARIKRLLKAGRVSVGIALDAPSCQSMTVRDLLMSLPRWGSLRTNRALRALQMTDGRQIGDLTGRQQMLVVEVARGERVRA